MEKLKEIANKVITTIEEGGKKLAAFIMANPKKAALITFGIGVVLGLLWADLENPVRH